MLDRINRSFKILKLTKKYFRANQITQDDCIYSINGVKRKVYGEQALSMLLDIVSDDAYGLRRFNHLDNIVDIGANIGVFSLYASTLFPKAKVFAYEPAEQSRLILQKNLIEDNIEINSYAVGNTKRKVILHNPGDISACYISLTKEDSSLASQECELISLDEVAAKLEQKVNLLKLDCEGSEYEIMQTPSLEKFTYIVGELHTCQDGNPEMGLKTLRSRGFKIDKWSPFPDLKAGVFWASNEKCLN
ncbi:FkbM family methyltransferase [Nostoc sp. 106C]|uniref:FkbM family methyltransferase n=1 Tax=Nostoc sp. 106C TaxID=1932667 RepID=UPI000A3CF6BD|nr:FkbM family methyltransferase [Nostoc sp. 106C]OUL30805.1 hypothetical protein BV375_13425 [Nostoc sp. 106C]